MIQIYKLKSEKWPGENRKIIMYLMEGWRKCWGRYMAKSLLSWQKMNRCQKIIKK